MEAVMDWNAAIGKNREALKRVLAMLVAMAGLGGASTPLEGRSTRSVGWGFYPDNDPHPAV